MGWNWDFMERYIFLALLPVCLGLLRFLSYICKGKNWSYSCLHGLVFGDKKMPWLFLTKILYKMRYCKDFFFQMDVVNFDLQKEFLRGRTWVGVRHWAYPIDWTPKRQGSWSCYLLYLSYLTTWHVGATQSVPSSCLSLGKIDTKFFWTLLFF